MVTRKEISNCLGDHPSRNTLIYESTYKVLYIGNRGKFWSTSKCNFLLSEGSYQVQECVCAFGFQL